MVKEVESPPVDHRQLETSASEQPLVKDLARNTPKPAPRKKSTGDAKPGLLRGFFNAIVGTGGGDEEKQSDRPPKQSDREERRHSGSSNRARRGTRGSGRPQSSASRTTGDGRKDGQSHRSGSGRSAGNGRQRDQRRGGTSDRGNTGSARKAARRSNRGHSRAQRKEDTPAPGNTEAKALLHNDRPGADVPAPVKNEAPSEINYNDGNRQRESSLEPAQSPEIASVHTTAPGDPGDGSGTRPDITVPSMPDNGPRSPDQNDTREDP